MRKAKVLLTTAAMISALTVGMVPGAAAAQSGDAVRVPRGDITVTVDGSAVQFDSEPAVQAQRVLVPLRKVCEALGARVEWEQDSQTIYMQKRDRYISMVLGGTSMSVNGTAYALDVPSVAENGRTLVPLRAIAQAMDADVQWNQEKQMVVITSKQGDHQIQDHWDTFTKTDPETGKLLYTENTVYPVLAHSDDSSAIAQINAACKKAVDDAVQANREQLVESAEELQSAGADLSTSMNTEMTIPYDRGGRMAVRYGFSLDMGGAHPMPCLVALNFDTNTGKELTLSDVLGVTQEEVLQDVRDAYVKDIAAHPDAYFEDAAKTAADMSEDDFVWYLTDQGVTVEADIYLLAPYAAGFPVVTLACPQA